MHACMHMHIQVVLCSILYSIMPSLYILNFKVSFLHMQKFMIMGSKWIVLLSLLYEAMALHRPEVLLSHCNRTDTLHDYCGRCAPNDFNADCRNNSRFKAEHVLPDEWELMLDSHDYQNLIQDSSPAWIERDIDGDGGKVFPVFNEAPQNQ